MGNTKGKILTTIVFVSALIIVLLSISILPQNIISGGQQGTPQDEQSTTGPVPVGGPNGAVGSAGENFTPGPISKIIAHVPPYIWRMGCGPTSATMILGYWDWYWDKRGYDWIIPGDASQQTEKVNQIIASTGHELDYAIPHDVFPNLKMDKSEPPFGDEHISNSVADFMCTSCSSRDNYFGWSWLSDIPKGYLGYLAYVNPGDFTITSENLRMNDGTLTWEIYKSSIDQNHPMMLLVDSNADGQTDHFIPGIAYDDSDPNVKFYGAYNTWDGAIHWYRWQSMLGPTDTKPGRPYGVYSGTTLDIVGDFPTATPTVVPTATPTVIRILTLTKTLVPSPTITPKSTIIIPTVTPTPIEEHSNWRKFMNGAIEMTDFSNLLVGGIPLILVIFGLVEVVKSWGVNGKRLTVVSLLLGLVFGMCYQLATKGIPAGFPDWFAAVVFSIALGLTTSGIYKFVASRTTDTTITSSKG